MQVEKSSASPKLERTSYPGIYKRGTGKRGGKPYVVIFRHRGKQHKSFHRTLAEAKEAKGERDHRQAGAPPARVTFENYARAWVESYPGRTSRGLSDTTRGSYRDALERF